MNWHCRLPMANRRLVGKRCRFSVGNRQWAIGNARLAALGVAIAAVVGCESSSPQSGGDMRSRQDAAVKDPWSYGPEAHDPKKAPTGELDPSKHPGDSTAKQEWDRFWNP
jgi:hypothetical protein